MIDETELRRSLIAYANIAKTLTEMLGSAITEISALRETVRGLDPTFEETFEIKRQEIYEKLLPAMTGQIGAIEMLVRKLQSGSVC